MARSLKLERILVPKSLVLFGRIFCSFAFSGVGMAILHSDTTTSAPFASYKAGLSGAARDPVGAEPRLAVWWAQ